MGQIQWASIRCIKYCFRNSTRKSASSLIYVGSVTCLHNSPLSIPTASLQNRFENSQLSMSEKINSETLTSVMSYLTYLTPRAKYFTLHQNMQNIFHNNSCTNKTAPMITSADDNEWTRVARNCGSSTDDECHCPLRQCSYALYTWHEQNNS